MDQITQVGPAAAGERIFYLDMLRGLSLFGIVTINMWGFVAPQAVCGTGFLFPGRLDMIVLLFARVFVLGKFLTIFSFLFGLGFAIQMSRIEARGARFMSIYPRRLLALALFGTIHALLIWWGDILLIYAISGAALLLFRNRSQKALLAWAAILASVTILAYAGFFIAAAYGHPLYGEQSSLAQASQAISTYGHGSFAAMVRENWAEWKAEFATTMLTPYALYFIDVFLIGLFVWRTGVLNRLESCRPQLKRLCFICLPLGTLLNASPILLRLLPLSPGARTILFATFASLQHVSTMVLSAGYVCAGALLVQSAKWKLRLSPFASVGRMALTNYLMQSILCVVFFRITGLYGHVSPAVGLIPTVMLYAMQVAFSAWWFTQFNFGPMEWLWRGLTYGKLPQLRKAAVPMRQAAA